MIDNRGYTALIYRSSKISEFQHVLSSFEQVIVNIQGF